jgi:hypothetical protein
MSIILHIFSSNGLKFHKIHVYLLSLPLQMEHFVTFPESQGFPDIPFGRFPESERNEHENLIILGK